MDEHSFIRYVHGKLDPKLIKWKIHDTFAGGVPDAFYLGERSSLWVEYKYVKALPKRDTTLIKTCLTELQKQWLDDLERCNQPCALVIGCEKQAIIRVKGQWHQDLTQDEFVANSVDRMQIARWINSICLKDPNE